MTPEGKVKAKVKKRLRAEFGDDCWEFMPVQNGMGKPGLDFFICFYGYFVAIETKADGKELTDRQVLTSEAICRAGGLVFKVETDEELDRCIQCLQSLNRRRPS